MRKWKINIVLLCFVTVLGCATPRRTSTTTDSQRVVPEQKNEVMGPQEAFGPPEPVQQPSYGPEPVQIKPVVLVLGPGLARGFAYVGAIRALVESKIPIGAVFGTEMGALVGALYTLSSSINQFEWGLQRFREDIFKEKAGFLSGAKDETVRSEKFEVQLRRVFENKDISLAEKKIPLRIVVQSQEAGAPVVLSSGGAFQIIRAAMAAPGLFNPYFGTIGHQTIHGFSASSTRPFLIREARNLNLGPVVVIHVLNDREAAIAYDELKEADIVIQPNMSGIGYQDFEKKTDAAFRGKSAIIQHMPELRRVVGLPESGQKE